MSVRAYANDVSAAVREAGEQRSLFLAADWVTGAEAEIVRLARTGVPFSADDVIGNIGPAPSPSAVGTCFARARRAGVIEVAGYSVSKRVSRHQGLQRVWIGRPQA